MHECGIALRCSALRYGLHVGAAVLCVLAVTGITGMGDMTTPFMFAAAAVASFLAHLCVAPEVSEHQPVHLASVVSSTIGQVILYTISASVFTLRAAHRTRQLWLSSEPCGLHALVFAGIPCSTAMCHHLIIAAIHRGSISAWFGFRLMFLCIFVVGVGGTLLVWLNTEQAQGVARFPPGEVSLTSSLTTWLSILAAAVMPTPAVRRIVRNAITILPLTAAALQTLKSRTSCKMVEYESDGSTGTPSGLLRRLIPSRDTSVTGSSESGDQSFTSNRSFPTSGLATFCPGRAFLPKEPFRERALDRAPERLETDTDRTKSRLRSNHITSAD